MSEHIVTATREELIKALHDLLWWAEMIEVNEQDEMFDELVAAQEAARNILYGG